MLDKKFYFSDGSIVEVGEETGQSDIFLVQLSKEPDMFHIDYVTPNVGIKWTGKTGKILSFKLFEVSVPVGVDNEYNKDVGRKIKSPQFRMLPVLHYRVSIGGKVCLVPRALLRLADLTK